MGEHDRAWEKAFDTHFAKLIGDTIEWDKRLAAFQDARPLAIQPHTEVENQ
jgi:hypothetical protein